MNARERTCSTSSESSARKWKLLWIPLVGLLVVLASASCSGNNVDGAASDTSKGNGFGCCPLPDRPSGGCTLILGRTKYSADDKCFGDSDGVLPDTTAPGWTVVDDAYGCPVWTPPPNVRRIGCGARFDAGSDPDAGDGGD